MHDINKPFAFSSNPGFIFHDSPGFEAGGEKELISVQQFIEERAKATKVHDQLHAIWYCISEFMPGRTPVFAYMFALQVLPCCPPIKAFIGT